MVSLVKAHPQTDEIKKHLINGSMTVEQIVNHYGTEDTPLTKDAINWYKRRYVKPAIEEAKENIKEEMIDEIHEEWRRTEFRAIEVANMLLQNALDRFKKGAFTINTINELMKILEFKAKIQGELKEDITIRFAWGDKLDVCPRFKKPKGQIYSAEDLNAMR